MFMLKFYLVSILIYWVSLMIATSIIKGQLKKEGLKKEGLKKEGLHPKKSSVVEAIANWSQTIANWSQTIIYSCLPVFNLVMVIVMFAKFDDVYYRVKKKYLPEISTNVTQLSQSLSVAIKRFSQIANLPPEGDK